MVKPKLVLSFHLYLKNYYKKVNLSTVIQGRRIYELHKLKHNLSIYIYNIVCTNTKKCGREEGTTKKTKRYCGAVH